MIIALAGYRGFIGKHIRQYFFNDEFILLERTDLYDDPKSLSEKIKEANVVINVAGFPVSKRWTRANRKKLYDSRITVTGNLVKAINMLEKKPEIYINGSAVGIYAFDEIHTEESHTPGKNFLAELVSEWEKQADRVSDDVRLVKMRIGLVLGRTGGAFPRLRKLFNAGLGGVIGNGKQVYSFIHIDDLIGAIEFLLQQGGRGVYNFTAPEPVTNRVFTRILAKGLNRRTFLPVPAFALRLIMGEAGSVITRGQTVYPKRLLDEGYNFTFASIESAIDNLVKAQ